MIYRPVPLARESLISKAADEIRRLIREQSLRPGEALPPETQLSKMLGISRNSLREALRILDGLGFVQKQPGRRVVAAVPRVVAPSAVEPAVLADAMPAAHAARMAIEERCAAIASQVATDADLTELESHLALFQEALKRGDVQAASDAHVAFHTALVTAAHNPILTAMFQQVSFSAAEMGVRANETLKERRQVPLHAAILAAIRARDAASTGSTVRRHFRAIAPVVEFVARELHHLPMTDSEGTGPGIRRGVSRVPAPGADGRRSRSAPAGARTSKSDTGRRRS